MEGSIVLITGATSGIGKATAIGVARMGARVAIVARNEKRGRQARLDIVKRSGNADVDFLAADLSTREAIRSLAEEFRNRYQRLDVLINNAAVVTGTRRLTPDGFETQFFVNHVAYFMLTCLLIDLLRANAPSRIVNMSSTAHSSGFIDFDDLQMARRYTGWQAYANTKLANVMFTYELARRLEGTGVTANCVHPGVIHTGLLRHYSRVLNVLFHALRAFFKKPEEGALTPIYVATSPEVEGVTGKYFRRGQPMGTTEESNDPAAQRRLWEMSEEMTGCAGMIPPAQS
jgi:NAD(P)-dependent dehydrogenase (short-subunit alcohol dehydrogenase family)